MKKRGREAVWMREVRRRKRNKKKEEEERGREGVINKMSIYL